MLLFCTTVVIIVMTTAIFVMLSVSLLIHISNRAERHQL